MSTKLWRIGYTEDDETHYTQALDDETIKSVYKDFDKISVNTDLVFWVECAETDWVRQD